jgi:hypothetical protein
VGPEPGAVAAGVGGRRVIAIVEEAIVLRTAPHGATRGIGGTRVSEVIPANGGSPARPLHCRMMSPPRISTMACVCN